LIHFFQGKEMLEKNRSYAEQIAEEVLLQTDCTQCGSCCRQITPVFSESDISRFVSGFGLSEEEFKEKYLEYDELREGYRTKGTPCPFLENNVCSNYEYRPEDCRAYPHLDSQRQIFLLMKTDYEHSICPVVRKVCRKVAEEMF
jgi:Fe-S-cluster containining protein